jgi:hypothetical protein
VRAARRLALLTLVLLAGGAGANQRIALVIGNDAYPEQPLFNPVNDARDVSAALVGLGFEVVTATDADLEAMQAALLDFAARIEDGATALVFYAGHGVQAQGRNYLIPVDAGLDSESALRFEALAMADVLEELEYSGSALNVVILDACRNNPFLRRMRGASRGLAAVDAATGTLIAYATAPGALASDGSDGNGLYTQHFLEALGTPGLEVEAVFKQVRIAVAEASGGDQIPWESSSLTGDFVFNQTGPAPEASATVAGVPSADREALFWDSAREQDAPGAYRAYLARFPAGTFAPLARTRLAALDAEPGDRCDDLSGRWTDRRSDRDCVSTLWIEADPAEPGAWRTRAEVCPAPGALGLLGGGTATGTVRLEDGVLVGEWRHGPCSGTTRITLEADCSAGEGLYAGTRGGFGTCAGVRAGTRIERAALGGD